MKTYKTSLFGFMVYVLRLGSLDVEKNGSLFTNETFSMYIPSLFINIEHFMMRNGPKIQTLDGVVSIENRIFLTKAFFIQRQTISPIFFSNLLNFPYFFLLKFLWSTSCSKKNYKLILIWEMVHWSPLMESHFSAINYEPNGQYPKQKIQQWSKGTLSWMS